MASPSPGYSVTITLKAPSSLDLTTQAVAAAASAGAQVTGVVVVDSSPESRTLELNANGSDSGHLEEILQALRGLEDVKVERTQDLTVDLHLGGKLEVNPTSQLRNRDDLSRAYTPGVARISKAIAEEPSLAKKLTVKGNTVAVVTDGSAVLGLGNIGPEAALPVMEGKAALFKQFADVDAWPVCLDTQDPEKIVEVVKAIAPVYGGINLEDISAPRCFDIENRLRQELDIPVFHDDQHGTAIVVLAALKNALRVVGKKIDEIKVAISGIGAAGHAIIQLLKASGVGHIIASSRSGIISRQEKHPDPHRQWIAENTNPENLTGTLSDAVRGADVFIGVSAPNVLSIEDLTSMAPQPIVFALSNPDPEIDPLIAAEHAAVLATGRSDFPNQINNVLAFPGVFRGLLDAGVSNITDEMLVAAAEAISANVSDEQLNASFIIPSVFDLKVTQDVAEAIQQVARRHNSISEHK